MNGCKVKYEDSASQVHIRGGLSERIFQKPCQDIVLNLSDSEESDKQLLTPSIWSVVFSPLSTIACRRASMRGVRRCRTVSSCLWCSDINGATKLSEVRGYHKNVKSIIHRRRNSGQKLSQLAVFIMSPVRLIDRFTNSGSRPINISAW